MRVSVARAWSVFLRYLRTYALRRKRRFPTLKSTPEFGVHAQLVAMQGAVTRQALPTEIVEADMHA
jgi:hypothetical protein